MGLPKDTPEDVLVEHAKLQLDNLLQQQTAPEDTAAIFVEPVIGEGYAIRPSLEGPAADRLPYSGYVAAPHAYLRYLREVCTKHGILLVAGRFMFHVILTTSCADQSVDEIQTGFCRTGKTFAIEHSGVTPDMIVYAKGFANGMPISGIVTRKEIMDAMPAGSLVSIPCYLYVTIVAETKLGWNVLRERCRLCCCVGYYTLHADPRYYRKCHRSL
jgi:4-aminobutyrate aminotransferase